MHKPSIEVDVGPDGTPAAATATTRIAAPLARVWSHILDVDRYPAIVPMLSKVTRAGDRVTVHLKFKVAFFSVGFEFVADATYDERRWLDLRWVGGEPRDLHIRFELADAGDAATTLRATISFDPFSLGWLTKYFLKHHPEIRYGIFPGCAYGLADSMRQASEKA